MNFSPFRSFKISATILKKPLAVFLIFFSLKPYSATPSLDQEFHALRTELAQVYEKIARLENRARAEQSVPVPSLAPTASTASVRTTSQPHDEEDQLFENSNGHDSQDQPESNDSENTQNQTRAPRTLSIDELIGGNVAFSITPVPPGWVAGTVTASALVPAVGQKPSGSVSVMPEISVQQAKLLLEKREMLRARHMLAELVRNHRAEDYPFALYWLGMLDLHENRLDSAFALFLNIYDQCKSNPNSEIQQLCVAALLRMAQTRLRQNNILQAKKHFEHCQKLAKSITIPLPRHILYGIRKMRATMKKLKKAVEQSPAPAIETAESCPSPAPAVVTAGTKELHKPIAQPLPHGIPAESGPLLLTNVSDGLERGPEKEPTVSPSHSTEDNPREEDDSY